MATIVLTAVGSALGGPIGAAVGAAIGSSIDSKIFAPKARHGPRLGDLAVQSSSYGTSIPKLFGAMRVAATVIWATDLKERRSSSGGGKGKPKTVNYSYSASFAVVLSGRPIRAVRRIWADGKLLRGAAGDFKTETKFRLHLGGEDQAVDPLIASAEGIGKTPAYRGTAYAVFENFQLADYGNRIPSLSFEVEADGGPVSIGFIAEALSGGAIAAGQSPALIGYAAGGDSVRGAIEELATFVPLSLTEQGERLALAAPSGSPVLIEAVRGRTMASGSGGLDEHVRRAAAAIASSLSLAYHDPARDYQTGLQRAFRNGPALVTEERALPVALSAAGAKTLAEGRLASLWAGRASATLYRSWRRAGLRPGGLVRIDGQAGLWRIERWLLEKMIVQLHLVRVPGGGPIQSAASPGRTVGEADLRHGPTTLRLVELPPLGEELAERPRLFVAAAGVEPGWQRAALMASFDGGESWQEIGQTAGAAVIGTAETVLPPGGSALVDHAGSFTVSLLNESMSLETRTDAALAAGGNVALVGEEVLQFGAAEALGDGRFRLSRLLRGRFGTEWAARAHAPGENFLLLDRATLLALDAPDGATGGDAQVVAAGVEDGPEGVKMSHPISGESLRPPTPVHLRAMRAANGDVAISWVRRSRSGWAWLDGADAPLVEEVERYEVTISGGALKRQVAVTEPAFLYPAADQAADGASGTIEIGVSQIGTHARSRPAALTIVI
jgi:hypothetical protein